MSLQDTLIGTVTIASDIVLGTILTWVVSYFIGKRTLSKLIKSLSNDPEVIKAIQALKKSWNPIRTSGLGSKIYMCVAC